MKQQLQQLTVENLGQIKRADVRFGDLTILVGPQATGKSIFLQLLNLVADNSVIRSEMKRVGIEWGKDVRRFFDAFFGEGMQRLWDPGKTKVAVNGKPVDLQKNPVNSSGSKETFFYVPAQRVLALRGGWPRPFSEFSAVDPFLVRHFSERLRLLMENEFSSEKATLFPQPNRLKKEFRALLDEAIFGSLSLRSEVVQNQKRLVLGNEGSDSLSLPFMVWSAGQREFIPLLMGLYWLLPPSKTPKRDPIDWVVIEEPEMGLHPRAIYSTLVLVMDLLKRGYRVCLSTHSTDVLDIVWAIRTIQEHRESPEQWSKQEQEYFLRIFGLPPKPPLRDFASAVLDKKMSVYYFDRETGTTKDISTLNPGSDEPSISGWGGLTAYAGRAANVVADVVSHSERRGS